MRKLRFVSEVFRDLESVAKWYRRVGGASLAHRFAEAFYGAVEHLPSASIHPNPSYKHFRRIFVPRFPYKIYFHLTEAEVVVVLVIHSARDSRRVQKLLDERGD
jgi:plasmid stabilization system protein ParE